MNKTIRLRPHVFSDYYYGRRRLLIRPATDFYEVRVGTSIQLQAGNDEKASFRVMTIRKYPSFAAALAAEDWRKAFPHAADEGQVLAILRELHDPTEEKRGVCVVELERIKH